MKWFTVIALALVLSLTSNAEAARRYRCRTVSKCETRNSVDSNGCVSTSVQSSTTQSVRGSMQGWAENEARRMAAHRTNGHTQSAPPGYFVGVGANGMTCQGRGVLVGEAHYQGKTVRVWKQ